MFFFNKNRQYFIKKGEKLVKKELDKRIDYLFKIQNKIELKNSDVLTGNIAKNRSIPKRVKKKVENYKQNL